MFKFLDGKKTYIGAAIIFVAGGLSALCSLPVVGICIDTKLFETLIVIGGAVATLGIRSAIQKISK